PVQFSGYIIIWTFYRGLAMKSNRNADQCRPPACGARKRTSVQLQHEVFGVSVELRARVSRKRGVTVGEPRSAEIFASYLPSWKAREAYARNPGLGASHRAEPGNFKA